MVAKNNEKVNMNRRQQNQKFPSFQMFRFAAGGVGGAANKNDRKFLVFAPARACRARPRRKCHSSKSCGFCPKYIRTLYNTHRKLGNEVIGSPATRGRPPVFGGILSPFLFSKAKTGCF